MRFDYCNALPAGCSQQGSTVLHQRYSVETVESRDHVTSLFRDHLHWLHVHERVTFTLRFVRKALHGLWSSYLADILVSRSSARSQAFLQSDVSVIAEFLVVRCGHSRETRHFVQTDRQHRMREAFFVERANVVCAAFRPHKLRLSRILHNRVIDDRVKRRDAYSIALWWQHKLGSDAERPLSATATQFPTNIGVEIWFPPAIG